MKKDEFLRNPLLKDIPEQKKELLIDLVEQADGTPPDKILPILVKTNARMKALGMSFTKAESELIIQVITENSSPAERKKYEAMQRIINEKQKKS